MTPAHLVRHTWTGGEVVMDCTVDRCQWAARVGYAVLAPGDITPDMRREVWAAAVLAMDAHQWPAGTDRPG